MYLKERKVKSPIIKRVEEEETKFVGLKPW